MSEPKPPADRVEEIRNDNHGGCHFPDECPGGAYEQVADLCDGCQINILLAAYDSLRQELEAVTAERDEALPKIREAAQDGDMRAFSAPRSNQGTDPRKATPMTDETPEEVFRLAERAEDTRRHLEESPNEAAGFWGIDACARISDLLDYAEVLKRERDEAYRKGAEAMREAAADLADGDYSCGYDGLGDCRSASDDIRKLPLPTPDQEVGE